ncbi:MAG: glycine--tRNA ligase [FCB group bacterium]|nr:glycine--tRNA ligase [FCB group bacterium]
MDLRSIENIVSLCKRRGFIFQSSEIYGGMGSTWDYGPLGVEMKKRIKDSWWQYMVTGRENVVGMDAAIFMLPEVWEASGHVNNFHDPLVDNRRSKKRYRLDHLLGEQKDRILKDLGERLFPEPRDFSDREQEIQALTATLYDQRESGGQLLHDAGIRDPYSGEVGDWTNPRQFNLMFKTAIGPVEDSGDITYLRPETAQGIFVNFSNVQTTSRQKLPFGIAQMGKAFRNEITTGNFLFRTREFEQMEMEFFIHDDERSRWLEYWSQERLSWFVDLGISPEKLRLRPHDQDELAHYSSACYDVEYEFPFGWSELEGIADRGTYDLDQHNAHSSKKQTYFDPQRNAHIVPSVIETSAGVDRAFLTCLVDAYAEEEVRGEKRVVLKLSPAVAPITCAVFPLVSKGDQAERAQAIARDLRREFSSFYDAGGSIGKRYRRQDEAGTPFGLTVDHQTMEDGTVTLRDRDTMDQIRIPAEGARDEIRSRLHS